MEVLDTLAPAATEARPGYKLTPLGWLPAEWEVALLAEVAEIQNNLRFPLSETVRKDMKGSYPYYGPTKALDFLDHFRIEGTYVLIAEDGDHFLKFQTHPMTLLVSGRYSVNNHAHVLKGTSKCLTEWIYWFFNHKDFGSHITRQGAGRYKLTKEALSKVLIAIPPLSEQKRIVALLNSVAKHIDITTDLLHAKRRYQQGLMQQLLTGQRRFPEFAGQAWREVTLGEFLQESREPLQKTSSVHHRITVRLNLKGIEVRDVRGTEAEESTVYYRRRAGQFIYGKQNLHKGAFGIIPAELDGYESTQDVPTLDFLPGLDPAYFYYWMAREDFYPALESHATGTGSKRIQPASLFRLNLLLPSLPEQRRIAAVLTALATELHLLATQRAHWQQQKQGLLQALLTGAVRVNTTT